MTNGDSIRQMTDDYKPKLSPLLKAALFPAFLSSVSDYMGEIEDGGADNG